MAHCYTGNGLMHLMFTMSTDCIKRPHGVTDTYHSSCDVCTTKLPLSAPDGTHPIFK